MPAPTNDNFRASVAGFSISQKLRASLDHPSAAAAAAIDHLASVPAHTTNGSRAN